MAEEWKKVSVLIDGLYITVTVRGTSDMTLEDFEEKAREEIKTRLLNYWNAYCE